MINFESSSRWTYTITFPENSFVQFPAPVEQMGCAPEVQKCLPIMLQTDVRFQMLVHTNSPAFAIYMRVVSDCSQVLTPPSAGDVLAQFNSNDITVGEAEYKDWLFDLARIFQTDLDLLECGQCCYLQLWLREFATPDPDSLYTDTLLECSNCFQKICDDCFTTVISYRCDEDAFGFEYVHGSPVNALRDLYNVIRLPMYFREPQFPTKRNVFVKSNGERKKLSARVEKEYTGITDWWPIRWAECLVIALEHDTVNITNSNQNLTDQLVVCESGVELKYEERLQWPLAKGDFKVKLTPYNNYNSNCL